MKTLLSIAALAEAPGPITLALGVFDGIHRGHASVIAAAREAAEEEDGSAVTATFDPNPASVLGKGPAKRILTSLPHKTRLIEKLGIEFLLVIPFNRALAALSPGEFVALLIEGSDHRLSRIVVGQGWRFGKNRTGNLDVLGELGRQHGFAAVGIPALEQDGEPISSTRVRRALAEGDFQAAAKLLGRPFSVFGEVIEGRRLGRKLGFPTANFRVWNEVLPPEGVYAVEVALKDGPALPGVANLGRRPTVEGEAGRLLLEVHLLDFDRDIYGAKAEVRFRERLRGEQKFAGLKELTAQITKDLEATRAHFGPDAGLSESD